MRLSTKVKLAAAAVAVAPLAVPASMSALAPASAATPTSHVTKVLQILEENHGTSAALKGMPYFASLAKTYGYASNYSALTHPSLPNYLALTGGSTFGVTKDVDPSSTNITSQSLFGEVFAAGKIAKSYHESMPQNCDGNDTETAYSVHHNPWTYFSSEQLQCTLFDVPLGDQTTGQLALDVKLGLPDYSLVVPDNDNDAHDGTLAGADGWLKSWLPIIMSGSDYQNGNLAIVITFDESEKTSKSNLVPTVVISPTTSHITSSKAFNHYSLLRTTEDILGVPLLGKSAKATSMVGTFHL